MTELLLSSTVLIAVVVLLRALFKNRISRRLQYALWLIVAIRLMAPIQFGTSPISIQRMEPEKLEAAITQTTREPIAGPSYTVIYSQVAGEYASTGQNVQTPAIRHEIEVETAQRITVPTVGEIANTVWFLGAVVMSVWFLFVNLRFRRNLRKNAAEITVPGCHIPVKVCPTLTSPCLSGLFRPTVYLTESCADDPQRLRHILAHELTHLRHGDLLWSMLRSILLCLYWFHPLVWVAAVLSKRDCELACDEGALARLGEDQRIAYGKTLLDTVARRPSPNHLLETATSMNETKKQLKERVNFIVKKPKFYLILTLCLLLITAVAIGCTFTGAPDNPNWTCPCSIMVDGVQYHTYFEKADLDTDSIAIAGNIKKQSCDISDMPTENDTSNFGTCVGEPYTWVDGQLYLRCNGQWNVCVNANTQDIPKTTTSPTETTVPSQFDQALMDEITALFTGYYNMNMPTNWYNAAMLATFDSPQDIDAYDLFEVGTGVREDRIFTDEELAYLRGVGFAGYMDQGHLPCRMSREYVESVLDQYFGLTTADLKTEGSRFTYWKKTDSYYVISKGHAVMDFRLLGAVRQEDGTILFEYYSPYDVAPKQIYETVIRPVDGGYHVLSNRKVEKSNLNPDAEFVYEFRPDPLILSFYDHILQTNLLLTALNSSYATPADVNLLLLLYTLPTEELTQEEIDFAVSNGLRPDIAPIHRYSVETMDYVLQRYFGITFEECNGVGLDQMLYNPTTDCYYHVHGDSLFVNPNPTEIQQAEDGTLRIYYEDFVDYKFQSMVVTIVPNPGGGGYQIVSNVPTEVTKTYTDTSWQATTEGTKLSYEDFFSKTREFTDSQAIYEKRWRIDKNGAMTDVEKATDGYALLHDENGFFIVSFENYDGGDWSTGTRKGDWYHYTDAGSALEVIWQVPNTDGIKSVDHYLTDGRYVYYIQHKKFIDQVDLLTGQRYRIFEAKRICVESDHCMILYDQSVLIFLTQTKDTVAINRIYLPTGNLDVLYDQIPLEQIHSGSNMHCTDSDTIQFTIMEPNFLNRLWEIVRDPNSSCYNKHADETVLYHELFGGADSIMKSTTWKELSGHTEFIELAQSIEKHEEIPSLLHCSFNTRTGEYSETPDYWDPHMSE